MSFKVLIAGLGFVGGSMLKSFSNKGLKDNVELFGYDKFKDGGIGSINDAFSCNIVFLALPTPFNEEKLSYETSAINECCEILSANNYSGALVIKSTVEPETTNKLSNKFPNLHFIHNPEFLTAKTAYEDFHNQKHIVLGKSINCSDYNFELVQSFYKTYYPDAEISLCTSLESESMKIFCNSFYAVKVQFFTELYLLTQSNGSNYKTIVELMLKNKWINPMHTVVPGPDGSISYGGLCFPKDTNALNRYMDNNNIPNQVLTACIKERDSMRDDHLNVIKKI
jgi:UDPglucose 6-dehydrogenase